MLYWFVMLETDLTKEVEAEKSEYDNPDGKIYLSVEDTPVVCLVCHAEELESECHFHKSEHNLYRVQPSATALLEFLEKRW